MSVTKQTIHELKAQSVPPASAAANAPNPCFSFRLPKASTVDPYFGGARTWWNSHLLPTEANDYRPPIKSIVSRQPGAKRGIRFIVYSSALEFFHKLEAEQNDKETTITK